MISKLKFLIVPTFMFLPLVAFGQTRLEVVLGNIQDIIGRLVPTLVGLALVLFLWGVLRYLFAKDGVSQKEAREFMLWGILALFVMVSVWGLVNILGQFLFGTQDISSPDVVPGVPRNTN